MSLVKILMLVLATSAIHIAMTAPNQPPVGGHRTFTPKNAAVRFAEVLLKRIIAAGGLLFFKIAFWAVAICESLVVLSAQFPDLPGAQGILDGLLIEQTRRHSVVSHIMPPTVVFLISASMAICGGTLRLICFRTLGASFTFELSRQNDHKLVTSGVYSLVRHPSYTGAVLDVLGISMVHLGRGSWIRESGVLETIPGQLMVIAWLGGFALINFLAIVRLGSEEDFIREEFGDQWVQWTKSVPYRLFPGIY